MTLGKVMQQMAMFETPKREGLLVPTESMYWMCVSSLQKFIRRGMEEQAVKSARLMYEFNLEGLKRRLLTIMLEDVGLGDWPTVVHVGTMLKPLGKRDKIWEAYEECTRMLCRATKNRDTDDAGNLIYEGRIGKVLIQRNLHPDLGEVDWLYKEWWPRPDESSTLWWNWAEDQATAKGRRCFEAVRWLRPFAGMLRNHPGLCAGLLLFRWDTARDELSAPVGVKTDPEITTGLRYLDDEGFFPDFVMDGHTRAGKIVYGKLQKELGLAPGTLHLHQFFSDGARLDRWAHWANDYRSTTAEQFFPGGAVESIQRDVDQKLFDLRRWAFGKIVLEPHRKELK